MTRQAMEPRTKRAGHGAGKRTVLRVSEKDVERRCDSLMSQLCWNVVRFSQPRHTMQSAGIPDRKYYNVARGLTLWFECKKPGGTQSLAQKQFQQMCEACGERYVLGGVDELLAALDSITRVSVDAQLTTNRRTQP